MPTSYIIPGLDMDDELFAAAAEGLAEHVPDLPPLSYEDITDPMRWWRVPGPDDDGDGEPIAYKAEFLVSRTLARTVKVNRWYGPDLRSGETSKPHTHPWEVMEAHPVLGGYDDAHWHRTAAGLIVEQGTTSNLPGTVNRIIARDYHEVTAVKDPGRTLSVMVCGPWIHDQDHRGVWGHLDLHTGRHVPVQHDPVDQERFAARTRRINPQHTG